MNSTNSVLRESVIGLITSDELYTQTTNNYYTLNNYNTQTPSMNSTNTVLRESVIGLITSDELYT